MPGAGIIVTKDALDAFEDVKKKKFHYVVFEVNPGNEVVVLKKADRADAKDGFLLYDKVTDEAKAHKEPRFVVFDYHFRSKDDRPQEKISFLFWCPNNAAVKLKMRYASGAEEVKKKFSITKAFQATEPSELAEENIRSKFEG